MDGDVGGVSVRFCAEAAYPMGVPYAPPEPFPELRHDGGVSRNAVYPAVRNALNDLGLGTGIYGSPAWNPLGSLVKPGMTVLIKPNTVMHVHGRGKDMTSVVVHASVLRPIFDYVCSALKGEGRIIVGDSQLIFSNFEKAMQVSGIADLVAWYRDKTPIPIELLDFRQVRGARSWLYGKWRRIPVNGDPRGYVRVELGGHSLFSGIDPSSLRIAVASHREMKEYHGEGRHAYLMPRSVLEADVVINVAKLKTHRRTGVTLALKNFMGLPAAKGALPHFRLGAPEEGGDQYIHPSARKRLGTHLHDVIQTSRWMPVKFAIAVAKKLLWESHLVVPFHDDVFEAMWPGNDTVWRTLLDIHRVVQYADKAGVLRDSPQRACIHLIDGVVGGQGDGPLSPDPAFSSCILAGRDAVAVDVVAAGLMGFDHRKIRLLAEGLNERSRELPVSSVQEEHITVAVDGKALSLAQFLASHNFHFDAHPGWKGLIERA
jgi:uncharacterized protein (DUF362 family)